MAASERGVLCKLCFDWFKSRLHAPVRVHTGAVDQFGCESGTICQRVIPSDITRLFVEFSIYYGFCLHVCDD